MKVVNIRYPLNYKLYKVFCLKLGYLIINSNNYIYKNINRGKNN